jgi:HSP20 family protein
MIVVADLRGVEKNDVSLQILNLRTLEISCERKGEKEEKSEGYYVRERVYGSMQRLVTLPADVTEKDAKASFKNGVLEVRLNKTKISLKSRIEIE